MKSLCFKHELLDCNDCDLVDAFVSGKVCDHDDIDWGGFHIGNSDFVENRGKCLSCNLEIKETFTPSMRYYKKKNEQDWHDEEDISI